MAANLVRNEGAQYTKNSRTNRIFLKKKLKKIYNITLTFTTPIIRRNSSPSNHTWRSLSCKVKLFSTFLPVCKYYRYISSPEIHASYIRLPGWTYVICTILEELHTLPSDSIWTNLLYSFKMCLFLFFNEASFVDLLRFLDTFIFLSLFSFDFFLAFDLIFLSTPFWYFLYFHRLFFSFLFISFFFLLVYSNLLWDFSHVDRWGGALISGITLSRVRNIKRGLFGAPISGDSRSQSHAETHKNVFMLKNIDFFTWCKNRYPNDLYTYI